MALWLYNLSGDAMFGCVRLTESHTRTTDVLRSPVIPQASEHLKRLTVAESQRVGPHVL